MFRGQNIGGATRVVGVIGHPVAHSRSPAMHNAAFTASGLDWVYLAWDVAAEGLAAAVAGLRGLGVAGFNVTVPHKVAVLPLLDELGEEAAAIGAVNTVLRRNGRWWGENTDAEGFLRSLGAAGLRVAGSRVVVLGAGGAARAVGYALVRAGAARVHLANRTSQRAAALAHDLTAFGDAALTHSGLDGGVLRAALAGADLIVQATPLGLSGAGVPVPVEWLPPGGVYYELGYGPQVQEALAAVRARGLGTLDGEEMLLHQGALAFTRWTGEAPSLTAMRDALRRQGREEEESSSGPSK